MVRLFIKIIILTSLASLSCKLNQEVVGTDGPGSSTSPAPILLINSPIAISEAAGNIAGLLGYTFSTSDINLTDENVSNANIEITITTLPTRGQVYNNNSAAAIGLNQSFTMSDIVSGYIEYRDVSSATVADNGGSFVDNFAFSYTNGISAPVTGNTFSITVNSFCSDKAGATDHLAYGAGTKAEPYQICTPAQLDSLNENYADWNSHYILRSNLDMTAYTEANFAPIGNSDYAFKGSFDGHGNTISNFSYDGTGMDFSGLFGYTKNAEIKNLNFTNFSIQGDNQSGALVGYALKSDILNINGQGTVDSSGSHVGGIVGFCETCNMSFVDFAGDVDGTGSWYVGGIVGIAQDHGISENIIYSGGNVTTQSWGGGIVGYNAFTHIKNVYAVNANVTGLGTNVSHGLGTIAGTTPRMHNAFGRGTVVGSTDGPSAGRVGPAMGLGGGALNTFYSSENICNDTGIGGPCNSAHTSINTAPGGGDPNYFFSKANEPLASWDFDIAWNEVANDYPTLNRALINEDWGTCADHLSDTPFAGGTGSRINPYLICTVAQLENIKTDTNYLKRHFKLMANLDLSGIANFVRIGDNTNTFSGTFNGNNLTLSNLTMNYPTTDNIGFFGRIEDAMIWDLNLTAINVTGQIDVGGLVGSTQTPESFQLIKNVYVQGSVTGTGNHTGGIVGRGKFTRIVNSHANVVVNGVNGVGGLVGKSSFNIHIENSFFNGSVTGTSNIGCLFGREQGATGNVIEYSFASCDVTGTGVNVSSTTGETGGTTLTAVYYDNQKLCSGCTVWDGTAVDTSPGGTPDYFFIKTNIPMNNWDFDVIWDEVANAFPRLK